jgi:tellurite resistance protein TerC
VGIRDRVGQTVVVTFLAAAENSSRLSIDSVPLTAWAATIAVVLALFALDFVIAARRPHVVEMREATAWSVFYIAVAIVFGGVLWALAGSEAGTEYFAGWIVEKSLSVDNLFVFVIIMARFAVPPQFQQKVLLFGIGAALVMRAGFIAIGAAAISLFSWTFVVFGLILIWTAIQLFRHHNEDADPEDNAVLRWAQKRFPSTSDFHNGQLLVVENGRKVVTPLFFVLLAIGSTDLLFALDSIPAIFGITQVPFIVFAANAFALLGLRALYFLIQGLLQKLVYLSLGLSAILAFIGVKLIMAFLHEDVNEAIPHVPTLLSLAVILGVLAVTTVASLVRVRSHPEEKAHSGSLRHHEPSRTDTEKPARPGR